MGLIYGGHVESSSTNLVPLTSLVLLVIIVVNIFVNAKKRASPRTTTDSPDHNITKQTIQDTLAERSAKWRLFALLSLLLYSTFTLWPGIVMQNAQNAAALVLINYCALGLLFRRNLRGVRSVSFKGLVRHEDLFFYF